MAKKKLTPEQEKEIKLLQANNEMLEKTKEEAKLRGTQNAVKRIEIAQEDVIAQIAKIDEEAAKETLNKKEETPKTKNTKMTISEESSNVFDALEKIKETKNAKKTITSASDEIENIKVEPKINNNVFNEIPNDVQYDIISLPSNGECYSNKIGRIPVGYLTAYDENFLTSPNLYQDGLVIDFLLNNKILDKDFDIDNMCSGDADAVILFLRATSYGAEFPISVRDPQSGERFDTVVDLTTFKNKEFNLKGDENGYFSYTLPLSKAEVKFKYLSRKEEKDLELLSEIEDKKGKSTVLRNMVRRLTLSLKNEDVLDNNEIQKTKDALKQISYWADKLSEDESVTINKLITNRMEMNVVSINGNTDREYISKYIRNIPARDSFMLRKYITANEPGINWNITVQRPESLGGGSFDTFLNWDDTVFFNISEG